MPPHCEPRPSFQRASPVGFCDKAIVGSRLVASTKCKHGPFSNNNPATEKSATTSTSHAMTISSAAEKSSYITHGNHHAWHAPSSPKTMTSSTTKSNNGDAQTLHTSMSSAPAIRTLFDPWNSSSTGHQRAENRVSGSTSWRESRNLKLGEQYRGGLSGGGRRVADTVGAGSLAFGQDGRKANGGWEKGAKGLRTGGQKSLVEVWGATKKKGVMEVGGEAKTARFEEPHLREQVLDAAAYHGTEQQEAYVNVEEHRSLPKAAFSTPAVHSAKKQIFDGLCFYLNGSTAPLISDHKLKHLLAERGGRTSIGLGRRSVTHVILGTANSHGGAGGGLAASKLQKEIARVGGKGVKFVSVEWVLSSIKADSRLPEARFSALKLAAKSQNSVYAMFRPTTTTTTAKDAEEGSADP